jgi:cell division protein FtsZ
MGTGEASGEKRALAAAEAAISNPLIDDSSMKGARGLLISITGGKDLTLYEVDEAATRIREEVDQEANIIVGATFDEVLDGIIRVSVVATGIDQAVGNAASSIDSRLAELTQKLRSNTTRLADRIEREPTRAAEQSGPPARAKSAAAPASTLPPATAIEDVTIRPIPPKPSLFLEAVDEQPGPLAQEPPPHRHFIPPQAERAPNRAARMPRIEDLPLPAQNQIRASRGEIPEGNPEKRRTSLLQRLAAVGLGRREEEEPMPQQSNPTPRPQSQAANRAPAPAPRRQEEPHEPVSEYAKRSSAPRPAPQGLDPHGRPAPVHNPIDEDHLEIPAFLRRQAN